MSNGLLSPGFSDAAQYVQNTTMQGRRHLQQSNVFGIESTLRDELATVWEDCSKPNWDGFKAHPVSRDTLRNAYVLLESLPLGSPSPLIGAEPDGDMTLEWHCGPRRTLSVSVTASGDLHYAALLGPNRKYGTEAFFGEVPATILDIIRQVYAQ